MSSGHTIRFDDWPSDIDKSGCEAAIRTHLLGAVDRNVRVAIVGDSQPPRESADDLGLWIHSSGWPKGSSDGYYDGGRDCVFDVPLVARNHGRQFVATSGGRLVADSRGVEAGQIFPNDLYLFCNPFTTHVDAGNLVVERFLEEVAAITTMSDAAYVERWREIVQRFDRAEARRQFTTIARRHFVIHRREVEERRDSAAETVGREFKRAIGRRREQRRRERELRLWRRVSRRLRLAIEQSYDRTLQRAEVAELSAWGGRVNVFTRPVTAWHLETGTQIPLGRYRVEITLDGSEPVRVYRIGGPVEINGQRYHAPGVDADGVVSWGDRAPALVKALGDGQIDSVVDIAIERLRATRRGSIEADRLLAWEDACACSHDEPRAPETSPTVSTCVWSSSGSPEFREAIEALARKILLPAVGRDVVIDVPDGWVQRPIEDGTFHVYYSSNSVGGWHNDVRLERLYDIPVDYGQSPAVLPRHCIPLFAPEAWPVAALVGDDHAHLYILHDAVDCGTEDELRLNERIFREVAARLMALRGEAAEELEAFSAECEAGRRAHFVDHVFSCLYGRNEEDEEGAIDDAARSGRYYVESLIREEHRVRSRTVALAELERLDDDEVLGEVFDQIAELPNVLGVRVSRNKLQLFTDWAVATCDSVEAAISIGLMRIDIPIRGSNASKIRFWNLVQRVEGYNSRMHHPHVSKNGSMCWGNNEAEIDGLVAQCDYLGIAQYTVAATQLFNTNDRGGALYDRWPIHQPETFESRKETRGDESPIEKPSGVA